jgi:hypothetical protein
MTSANRERERERLYQETTSNTYLLQKCNTDEIYPYTCYVTSSYMLCHIIIHAMSHHHTYLLQKCNIDVIDTYLLQKCNTDVIYMLCHIIIHAMSHHHTYLLQKCNTDVI